MASDSTRSIMKVAGIGLVLMILTGLEARDVSRATFENKTGEPEIHRSRRYVYKDKSYSWPKAVVPYIFADDLSQYLRDEAHVAMTRWEKYTCIRFIPWTQGETKEKYGLPKDSYMNVYEGDGCTANVGYAERVPQWTSCCSQFACFHELGHTLGLPHEHTNPSRDDIVNIYWGQNVPQRSKELGTYIAAFSQDSHVNQYDFTNDMHGNSLGTMRMLYEDLKPLIRDEINNQFSMYKDISLFHDCQEKHCSSFNQKCHNAGFVTLVDNKCSCLCPKKLDPATGCATALTKVTTSSEWPAGSYALLSSVGGCPGNQNEFSGGRWQHKGKGNNEKSEEFHLAGSFEPEVFKYEFCVKENSVSASAPAWERGRYCILRVNGKCPDGFKTGSIEFDDAADSPKQFSGKLPDGVFSEKTKLEFCCRFDGFDNTPLSKVPNTKPLVLFPAKKHDRESLQCQEISGMRSTLESFYFDGSSTFNGEVPYHSSGGTISYCHYVPLDLGCGGTVTLSRSKREVTLTSPNYPSAYGTNLECTWLIKAEEKNSRVLLNFNDVKLTKAKDALSCQDELEIRYNFPGQPGIRYCGNEPRRTIRSLEDVVIVTLRADHHQVATDTGFSLKASLFIPDEEECFDPATKGTLYRGQKDYTRSMKPCLDWTKVTECPHHAFNTSDFGAGLDKNYCRNPDHTAMAWCYTDTSCERDYCDVCNVERVYDSTILCNAKEVCGKGRGEMLKSGCAATCKLEAPAAPVREKTCKAPDTVADADILQSSDQTTSSSETYKVGDKVTYKCRTGKDTLTRTCLSNGEWSPAGYVCGACRDDWAFYKGGCYKYIEEFKTFSEAQESCKSLGSDLASLKDEATLSFVSYLRPHMWTMWSGASNPTKSQLVWPDGSPVTWTNWAEGKDPDTSGYYNCVLMWSRVYDNKWRTSSCSSKFPFSCTYSLSARQTCADRNPDCSSVLLKVADTCSARAVFASQQCPHTCGVCQPQATPACKVSQPASSDVTLVSKEGQIVRGGFVQYTCRSGYVLTAGQLMRACGKDGQLMGQEPVCKDPETIVQESSDVELIPRAKRLYSRSAYTGLSTNLRITRKGVIKQWKFFSPTPGWTVFQVWRPDPKAGEFSYVMVGQNQVMTSGQGQETHTVAEEDWIHVQAGDSLGIWQPGGTDPSGNVPMDSCDKNTHPKDFGASRIDTTRYKSDFSTIRASKLLPQLECLVFSYKAVIFPLDSVHALPKLVTSPVGLFQRAMEGSSTSVYLEDSQNSYIPADGTISEWQFYVTHSGKGAFQVWRREQGVRRYKFIGQNKLSLTVDKPHLHILAVPTGERIVVKKGDIIAVQYDEKKIGVTWTRCNSDSYPEAGNSYWLDPMTSEQVKHGQVYDFSFTSVYMCRSFSFRAVLTQGERQTCVDRNSDCMSLLLEAPDTCSARPVFANQRCAYTCGVCQPDATPACKVAKPASSDVTLVSKEGQIVRGGFVQYTCRSGFVVTAGQLMRACGKDGQLMGQEPVCKDPDTIVQESNDVQLIQRAKVVDAKWAYTGVSANLRITRKGVIKQWKFFSPTPGWTVFQVWRPDSQAGEFSYILAGQNQVMTSGQGQETHNVAEADWIQVQSGDILGIWEPGESKPRGNVPYDECNKESSAKDFGASWIDTSDSYADFSRRHASKLSAKRQCLVFSFKAVIFPLDTVPTLPKRVSSQVGLFQRSREGTSSCVYLGDSQNSYIPADGTISEWQFYVTHSGKGALQVWRREQGVRRYKFIGQNKLSLTVDKPHLHILAVPAGERIVVKKGDIIAVQYDEMKIGVTWTSCNSDSYPEAGNSYWLDPMTSEQVKHGEVYDFSFSSGTKCRSFSFRAVLTQGERQTCVDRNSDCVSLLLEAPDTCSARPVFANQRCAYTCGVCQPDATPACKVAKPVSSDVTLVSKEGHIVRGGFVQYTCRSGYVVTAGQLMRVCQKDGQLSGQEPVCKDHDTIVQESNDVQLIQRAKVVDAKWAYTGVSANLRITRKGVIKQWKFFSPSPGWTVFQVWRPDTQAGESSYILAGQNQVMTSGQGQETHNVAEADWIHVQSGDILGIWEPGESKPRGNVPYDECNKESNPKDFGASWVDTSDSYADFSRRHASKLSAKRQCLVFSFKAVIFPLDSVPTKPKLVTSQIGLFQRSKEGTSPTVYLGDSQNSYIPADGTISEWQFYVTSSGKGAFQVWRREEGVRKYTFIGQNKLSLTVDKPHLHTLNVPAGERIAVKKGDIIAVQYDHGKIGVTWTNCNTDSYPEGGNTYWLDPMTSEQVQKDQVYDFSFTSAYLCRVFSFRAVVTQTP